MQRKRVIVTKADGTKFEADYINLCLELGFSAKAEFVKVNTNQTISFSSDGKPNDILALKKACLKHGLRMSRKLESYTG